MLELSGCCSNARRSKSERMTANLVVETTKGSATSKYLLEQEVATQR
jgi:hypothetical protein